MARLDAAQRAKLPDSAFALIDSRGRRRLPIYDEAHVRNALARFNQVDFEDDAARERARKRLLNAAKKHRIVPVGFIDGQLRSERELALTGAAGAATAAEAIRLPSGFVTMLMTDIEGSTALVQHLEDRYRELIDEVRAILRSTVTGLDGHVVEARADDLFAVFEQPHAAVLTAMTIQRELRARTWPDGLEVRVRAGIHSGYPTSTENNYIGMAVHTTARISAAAHGGQIVVSGDTRAALTGTRPEGVRFKRLGEHRLRGIPGEVPLFQVAARGLMARFPPLRT
ncbi:MAG: adenylate/guanylate cyclase domain-containing protein [Acidimicrobiia bacterium]